MGGFFGTISKTACRTDLFYGTDYNSHLGTKRAGLATFHEGIFYRSIHSIENSHFRTKFESSLNKFIGNSGIGVISDTDSQPIVVNSRLGRFALVTVARINNSDELESELLQKGLHFSELSSGKTNQTELIALLIMQGKTFTEGIEIVFDKVKGSCSMLLLTEFGIIAARDKLGRTPVVLGKKDGAYAVTGEPCGFSNLGFETDYFAGPGEILLIEADKVTQLRKPNDKMQICSFLWVYFGYPVSDYEGFNVDAVRYNSGLQMSELDDVEVDFVSGIPDSGVGQALGYAAGLKVPYRRAIVKYTPTWPRSFTPSNQEVRRLVAKMKLIPNQHLLNGKRIVFCDDSIVRGTQLRNNVEILYGYGAKEVHMRIGSPPLMYPCPYLNFSDSKSDLELVTRRVIRELEGKDDIDLEEYAKSNSEKYERMVECIRTKFCMSSLKYNTLDVLINAIGLPKEKVCTHCFDASSYF